MSKIFLIIFGPQGSGKGTQAEMLKEKLNIPLMSTGELFRQEIAKGSKLGKIVKPLVEQGKIVKNEIFKEIIARRLADKDAQKGVIFDGYPRDSEQQDFLVSLFSQLTNDKDSIYAILIDISDNEVKERIGGRRSCDCGAVYHLKFNPPRKDGVCDLCGKKLYIRDDDKPEVIAERLRLYHSKSKPMFDYWRQADKLIKINGEQSIEKVQSDIIEKLKEKGLTAQKQS